MVTMTSSAPHHATHVASGGRNAAQPSLGAVGWFVNATGILFLGLGVLLVLAAVGSTPPLVQRDALFGFRTRTVLWLVGPLHLALGGYLLLAKDLGSRGFLALWAGVNYAVYYLGMLHGMKVIPPFPVEVLVAWESGLSSNAVDALWRGFSLYLVLGGLTLIFVERRQLKRLATAAFLGRWKQLRQQQQAEAAQGSVAADVSRRSLPGSQSAPTDVGGYTASANRADGAKPGPGAPVNLPAGEFKFSCPLCGQHIRCDHGYSGRQINCPACHREIRVPLLADL